MPRYVMSQISNNDFSEPSPHGGENYDSEKSLGDDVLSIPGELPPAFNRHTLLSQKSSQTKA